MRKYLISAILILMVLALGLTGCNNTENQIVDKEINNTAEVNNSSTNIEPSDNINDEASNNGSNNEDTSNLEEVFPLYVQYLGTIADSINNTLVELETKDQYYFEQNPNEGIDLLYNIITDYKGYISVLEDLEYNVNPDIGYLNSLFIDGLEENIKVFELSIESLKKGSYNEEEYNNQLTVVQDKFDKFSKEYTVIAEKAGYVSEQ